MWQLGPYRIASRVVLAPMAGVSDAPFRQLCRAYGAGFAPSEMLISDSRHWGSRKSSSRLAGLDEEAPPRVVQIAGSEPAMMADAARLCVARGAQVVDINMGCPAKKVCRRAAGSALLRDEPLVAAILSAVVEAVNVPVTLKLRTGWCTATRNATKVGVMAESLGIQALTLHGRTRACGYHAPAEYDTIADLVSRVRIPVIANGDITTAERAAHVLQHTGAAAVMVGRAAHGQPWLIHEMAHYLAHGERPLPLSREQKCRTMLRHVEAIHRFHGDGAGVKFARKHVAWYAPHIGLDKEPLQDFHRLLTPDAQADWLAAWCAASAGQGQQGIEAKVA